MEIVLSSAPPVYGAKTHSVAAKACSYYSRAAADIWSGKLKRSKDVQSQITPTVPNDALFRVAFIEASVASSSIARYYLQALQQAEDGGEDSDYVPNFRSNITLEHVLPSKPDVGTWTNFTEDERKIYVNRIGNLALLASTGNGKIGSKDFITKKPVLKTESEFSLTKEIGNSAAWGQTEILKRQEALALLAVRAWAV